MKKIAFVSIFALLVICLSSCSSRRTEVSASSNASKCTHGSIKGKCAVMDFQASTNMSAEEVEAITNNFRTGFYPSDYKIIETDSVNKTIKTLGYNKTGMTKDQLCELGRHLEANFVVVGTVNKFMDEYSVDVQVINAFKGTTVATQGEIFQKSNYLAGSKTIAQRLANKL